MSGALSESRSRIRIILSAFLILGVGIWAGPVGAQQTGTIAGSVASVQGGQPLAAAQVYIAGIDIGALTQANGRYILLNVPAGTHTLTAERIGYRTATATVTVAAGGTAVQDFRIAEEALQLDEVVVTGTAGGSQRRAIGNVVAAVDADQVMSTAPIATVEDLLQGRTPSVHLMPANSAGGGSKIRIRGHSSLALAADPIIYVDGVRLNDNRTNVGRQNNQSRLEDFDPNNIASIEIIKGPAAATLYGTEASNGVIQITTKRGQVGAPVFEFSTEVGQNIWPASWDGYQRLAWAPDPSKCAAVPCASVDDLIGFDYAQRSEELGFMPSFQSGLVQHYNASVRGGTDLIRYSFALSRNDNDGVVFWNTDVRNSVTTNINVTASEKLSLQLSGGYYQGEWHSPGSFWGGEYGWGGIPTGYFNADGTEALCGDSPRPGSRGLDGNDPTVCPNGVQNRGWRDGGPERYLDKRYNDFTRSKRSNWALTTNLDLTEWLSHRLTIGLDQVTERSEVFNTKEGNNFWWGTAGLIGDKDVNILDAPVWTVDFAGTATVRLMEERLGTATSYGVQYYSKAQYRTGSHGENFVVPALTQVSAAATTTATESFVENVTLGVYIQEQFDWDNRIFLTGAVRGDDNSAFGQNFDAAIYPKVSASWVLSEESIFDIDWLDELRVRGAWGQAGKQPDAFAASRLYSPETGPGAQPILTPAQFGNPDLGPEKGEELELGFDASVFNGRIGTSFTYYNRKTRDAIVGQTLPPSLWPGFSGAFAGGIQFVNVGQVSAKGTELSVNVQAIPEGPVRWDVDVAFTTQSNNIDDMGGIYRIQEGRARAHYEGFSLAAISDRKVVSADFVSGNSGPVTNIMCDGGTGKRGLELGGAPVPCNDPDGDGPLTDAPLLVWGPTDPTRMVNVSTTVTLFDNVRLSANVDAQWGHWISHDYATARATSHPSSQIVWLQNDPIQMAYLDITRNGFGNAKAGFAKLREVSLSYTIPNQFAEMIGASSANVRVGARNVARLWVQQKEIFGEKLADPEMGRSEYIFAGEDGASNPPLSQWTFRLGVTF